MFILDHDRHHVFGASSNSNIREMIHPGVRERHLRDVYRIAPVHSVTPVLIQFGLEDIIAEGSYDVRVTHSSSKLMYNAKIR